MKKIYLLSLFISAFIVAQSQRVVSRTFIQSFTKNELDSTLSANGIPPQFIGTIYGVDVYKLVYNTVSYDSSATIASGLMAVPTGFPCSLPIVSYQHSPMSLKTQAPSNLTDQEAMIALVLGSNGYVGIEPDYLGLGDGPGMHPFLHAQSEATAVIDMIRATREAADSLGILLNGQIMLAGYSQGGHATMAAHKMIQEKLSGEMQVTASFPMSGPYDMSGTMRTQFLTNANYPEPSMLAYTFIAYNNIYHFYDSLTNVLVSPLDTVLPQFFDGTQDFYNADGYINGPAYSIFNPDTLAAILADTNHPFNRALRDNDVYNWSPTSPVKMMYCQADRYVPYQNALTAYQQMTMLGSLLCDTFDVNAGLNHGGCSEIAILDAKEFVDNVADPQCPSAIANLQLNSISIKPNPATDQIEIMNLPASATETKIYSANGQLVWHAKGLRQIIPVGAYTPGLYIVCVSMPDGTILKSRFAKK